MQESREDGVGKIPPQAIDLEQAVLGAMLIDPYAIVVVSTILKPEHFYKDQHRTIFRAITKLSSENSPIDLLTVTNQLKNTGDLESVGGPLYISKLTNYVASGANTEYHSRIIFQKYIHRELISLGGTLVKEAFDESKDAFDLLDKVDGDVMKIRNASDKADFQSISDVGVDAMKHIESDGSQKQQQVIQTGMQSLDAATGGLYGGDLVIIAGRPGMGKSALMATIIRNVSRTNSGCAWFSMEMTNKRSFFRLMSMETKIDHEKIKQGRLSFEEKQKCREAYSAIQKYPIYMDDSSSLSIKQFRAKCILLKKKHNIKLIGIDYIQLMSGTGYDSNRTNEIGQISRGLKKLAMELDLPIIALSQLSREVEKRPDKRPQLSDLRESGSIEQDADSVWFVFRPYYYDEAQEKTMAELILAKLRDGGRKTLNLRFYDNYTLFDNYSSDDISEEDQDMPF